jgi:hypothetical protein
VNFNIRTPASSRLFMGLWLLLTASAFANVDRQTYPLEAPAGLHAMDSKAFDTLYIKPGFQPGNYGKLVIEQPHVAMQDYWKQRYRGEYTESDLRRISASTAKILRTQFAEKLSAQDGFALVETGETGEGVLRLKPSILNLHLNAPDLSTPGIKDEWVNSAGNATLYLDLYDASSGELLMRVIDEDMAPWHTRIYQGSRATNNRDLRNLAARWANALRKHLDEMNSGTT